MEVMHLPITRQQLDRLEVDAGVYAFEYAMSQVATIVAREIRPRREVAEPMPRPGCEPLRAMEIKAEAAARHKRAVFAAEMERAALEEMERAALEWRRQPTRIEPPPPVAAVMQPAPPSDHSRLSAIIRDLETVARLSRERKEAIRQMQVDPQRRW